MAINYTKIGWDTSKYVNPSNMNQMDDGIKAACDAIDSEVVKLTNSALQTIANTATGANAAISLKSNNVRSVADYRDQNGTALGMMGFDSNKKPTIYDVPANAWKEIALNETTDISSSLVYSTGSDVTINRVYAYKFGKVVRMFFDFSTTTTHALYYLLCVLTEHPQGEAAILSVRNYAAMFGYLPYTLYLDAAGHLCVAGSDLPAGRFIAEATILCA